MPRTKKHSKSKAKIGKKVTDLSEEKAKFDITDVLNKAQEFVDNYNYDMAQLFCQRALEIDNENLPALELTGIVLLEVGNLGAAAQCFERSVELSPDGNHTKYMYLGQLLTGAESIKCFRKGIELMEVAIESQENQPAVAAATSADVIPTMRDVSSAYLSIAELYMTDLCDENDAEEHCVDSIKKAIDCDDANPEGYQMLADYHLIKDEMELAHENIKKSVSLWLPKAKNIDVSTSVEDTVDPVNCISVSTEAQIKAAKTLIEVKEYEDATDILELLLDQDDTNAEIWYLLGWSCYLQGEDYKITSCYYLNKCKEVAAKHQYDDEDKLLHVEELLAELGPEDEVEDVDAPVIVESSEDEEESMEQA